jgi:hypothetical protein
VEQHIPRAVEEAPPGVAEEARPVIIEKIVPIAVVEETPIAAAESIPDEAPHSDWNEKPYESPSRLYGLRGLLFSIGLKNLARTRELEQLEAASPFVPARESKAEPVPEPEPEIERTVIARTFTPFVEPVPASSPTVEVKKASNAPREVTTLPEFLPPKELVPVRERESARESISPSRGDRRDAFDELQTLPSRRGQYKRRG